jgi:hypothetical protein
LKIEKEEEINDNVDVEKKDHVHFQKEKNGNVKTIQYFVNENVLYRTSMNGYVKWLSARILEKKSEHVYSIIVNSIVKLAHTNQLKKTIMKKKENFSYEKKEHNLSTDRTAQFEVNLRRSNRDRRKPDWFQAGV